MTSGPLAQRRLGEALRTLRERAGLDQAEAAKVIGADRTAITKIEGGKRKIRPLELPALLDAYQADPAAREHVQALAEARSEKGWWTRYGHVMSPAYAEYIAFESEATEVWHWSPLVVPGHLQTEDYARAVMQASGVHDVDQLLKVRLQRQWHFSQRRMRCITILGEPVLSLGADTAQLKRLLLAAAQPATTLQVVPATRWPEVVSVGGFTVLGYPDGSQAVWGDTVAGDSCWEEDKPDLCIVAFDRLRQAALDPDASRMLIRARLEGSL